MHITHPRVELMSIDYVNPHSRPMTIGLLLLNAERGLLSMRFREDWSGFDSSTLQAAALFSKDFSLKAQELGPAPLVEYLKATLTGTVRVNKRETLTTCDHEVQLEWLASELLQHVQPCPTSTGRRRIMPDLAIRLGVPQFGNAKLQLDTVLAYLARADVRYAVASGTSIVFLICAGVVTLSRKDVSVQRSQASFATISGASDPEDQVVQLQPSIADVEVVFAPSEEVPKKPRRTSSSRRSMRQVQARLFPPPEVLASASGSVRMFEPETSPTTVSDLVLPEFVESSISLPPPPSGPTRGLRRLLQAIATPFKRVGQTFSN